MKPSILLIILVSNQGYWIGGHEGTVNIRPAARGGLPVADVSWDLTFNNVRIANGRVGLAHAEDPTILRIAPPPCRQRILLRWSYRLSALGTGKELARGEMPIQLFPDDINEHLAQRLGCSQ